MRRGVGRAIPSNLPVPKASHGTPVTSSSSLARGHASHAKSAEDLSHSQGNTSSMQGNSLRRALSPGIRQNKGLSLSPARTSHCELVLSWDMCSLNTVSTLICFQSFTLNVNVFVFTWCESLCGHIILAY